jgi:predicted metal-dependent hydrolase
MILQVHPATGANRRQEILDEWYRAQLRAAADPLIAKWEPVMGVRVERVFVQRMKTKWGSCSRRYAVNG